MNKFNIFIILIVCLHEVCKINSVCPNGGSGSGIPPESLILYNSCKEMQELNRAAKSGIYYIKTNRGPLEVYCEMEIDGGGYTFFPTSNKIDTSILSKIYTDTSKVLFRLKNRNDERKQPYIVVKQLDEYSNIPISIQVNSFDGYQIPLNTFYDGYNLGSYIYFGFLPSSIASTAGMLQGISANDQDITYINCDANGNSHITLFYEKDTHCSYNPFFYFHLLFLNSAINFNRYIPSRYFYFAEIHQGGCGEYTQSNRWSDYDGVAFGVK